MYRGEVIQALFGRVGFRQHGTVLSPANIESRSGRRFQDFHAAVTIPNIREVANNDVAITDEAFNEYLEELQKACIGLVLDGIFSKPEIIEQQMIYERDDEQPQLLENTGKFVGYMIQVGNRTNISVRINALSLFFNGDVTFNIYVFNHLHKDPIRTIPVTVTADNEVIVPLEELVLTAIGSTSKSRTYFIGYYQDDLGAVKAWDYPMHLKRTGLCYSADGIEADKVGADFNRFNPPYTGRTYGLNMELSGLKDYTEVILRNQQAFDKAIGLQMAALVIERIMHSTRSNYLQRIGQEGVKRLYSDLNLDMPTPELPYSTGIKNQLRRELKRLYDNFFSKGKPESITVPSETCYSLRPLR